MVRVHKDQISSRNSCIFFPYIMNNAHILTTPILQSFKDIWFLHHASYIVISSIFKVGISMTSSLGL